MKASVYKVSICDSVVDMVHGAFRDIIEIYIPNKKIAFNEDSEVFHCFITNKERYEKAILLGYIEVPNAMSQAMTDYINISKRMGKTKKWYKRCVLTERFEKVQSRKVKKKLAKR